MLLTHYARGCVARLGFEYGVHSAEDDGRINGTNMYLSSSTLSDYELSQVRNHVVTAQAQVEHAALANELQQVSKTRWGAGSRHVCLCRHSCASNSPAI